MLFSSILFLVYFLPAVVLVNFLLRFSRAAQNVWLTIASLFFYAWGEPVFVLVMVFSILVNYVLGFLVDRHRQSRRQAKVILVLTCVYNIGLLFVFKYLGFVVENVYGLLGIHYSGFATFRLPLGISFFTFQAMSYVIDVYRQDAKVERNPLNVVLYVAFFPQLVAGPIVRFTDIAEQINHRRETWVGFSKGITRFVVGLGKKVLIANTMASMADHVFNLSTMSGSTTVVPVAMAWVGAIAYTLQIYFDFSGYSDMAIGLGHMFGFTFKENFNYPYISQSIVDFWRRWHISLSTWFREYVYFPLGGSRVENNDLMVRNTFVVWLLTGIWHGAEWTFLLWGLWNFIFIIFERAVAFNKRNIPRLVRHLYALVVIVIGWVLFRAQDLYQAFLYLQNLFGLNTNGVWSDMAVMLLRENWVFWILAVVFSTPAAKLLGKRIDQGAFGRLGIVFSSVYPIGIVLLYVACVVYLTKSTYNPFIYFNF